MKQVELQGEDGEGGKFMAERIGKTQQQQQKSTKI